MKKKYIFNRLCGFILFLCIIVSISFINEKVFHAYAMSQETAVFSQTADFSTDLGNEVVFMNTTDKSGNVILIEGANNNNFSKQQSISDFTDIKYISNANYFLSNPKHHENTINNTDNEAGTCTTVAMQMLLGYHNYYSDRRLIPNLNGESLQFLDENYGNLLDNPLINLSRANDQGRATIGTEDDVYHEIFDLTWISDWYGIGQAIGLVKDGAIRFVNKHATSISNEVMLESGIFSKDDAIADINNNRPIIVGFIPILSSADSFHVVVAYGYAKLNGENGFFVHYGWGDSGTQVWVPESWLGFQIRMEIDHIHSLEDTTENVNNAYRRLYCEECGFSTVDTLFDVENSTLQRIRYPLASDISIPRTFNTYSEDTAINTSHTITTIGSSAFANQTEITGVTLPYSLTSIGEDAFAGCVRLESINVPSNISFIGNGAFKGCTNLNISVASYNSHYSAQGNILYNKAKTAIVGSGKVDSNVVVPSTVTTILTSAFEDNHNLDTITFNNAPSIGDYAFKNCSELSYVYFNTNTAPTLGGGAFSNTNFIVYVPYDYTSQFNTVFNGIATSVTSKSSAVTFVCDGATVAPITIHYGETIHNLPTPSITGYTFEDWYEEENLQGKTWQNGDVWLYEENKTLYAKTTPNQYTVTLNPAEGTLVGNNQITVTYDELVSTDVTVSRAGSVFEGWYDENGVKYIDSDGNGVKVWDKAEDTTLTAHWRTESYQIRINDDGTIVWLGENGFSTVSSSIPYGAQLNAINLVPMFKASTHGYKEGKIFDHFVHEGSTLDWNWTTIPDLGEDGTVITIIPVWVLESHTIHFNPLCNMNVASIKKNYGEDIVLPSLNRTGYTFNGWTKETEPDTLVNWVKMPDLTLGTQANGSVQLVAKWTPNTYNVKYVANGGSGTMSQSVHTYDVEKALNPNAFWRTHYDFMGWSTTSTGEVMYEDCEDVINLTTVKNGMVTLYAVWRGERFNINYENREFQNQKADVLLDNYIGNYAPSYYEYGTGLQVSRVSAFWQSEGPYDAQLRFMGWYLDPDLTDPAVDITATDTGAVTWYAKWRYDFNYGGRYGTYTVTDANQMNQNYDQLYLGLGYDNLHQELLDIGIKNVTITFKINMWRTADQGTQYIYFYGGSDGTTLLQQYSFSVGSTKEVRRIDFVFDLEDLGAINYINVRYKASTSGWWLWEESDTWQNDETHYEVVYVTELDDKYALEFYWSYKDPFD